MLINCAGRAIPNYFERIPLAQLDETMRINFYGAWHAISTLLPHMRRRGGYIVNVSSLAGLIGVFGYTDYCRVQVRARRLLRGPAQRAAQSDGITVSVLCPPDTRTPGFERENLTKPPETLAISAGGERAHAPRRSPTRLLAGMAQARFLIIPGRDARFGASHQALLSASRPGHSRSIAAPRQARPPMIARHPATPPQDKPPRPRR